MLGKEIERVKVDVKEIMDQRFDQISRQLTNDTHNLKESYEKLCDDLTQRGKNLFGDFKDKMLSIKNTITTFFAKIEKLTEGNDAKVKQLQSTVDDFMATQVNPMK